MDPDDARAISDYLTRGIYPAGLSRDDKRSLRQKSTSFLVCDDGRLYHRGKEGRKQLVICDSAEKLKIINAMHTDRGGRSGHNGRNATLQRISLQYWWRHLVDDVRDYCKSCNDCIVRSKMPNQKYEIPIPSETVEDNVCSIESVCNVYNVELSSRSYASDLLSVLASFYNESVCCDVLLSAGRYQTRAHKVVLIAASGYFKSMLLDTDLPFNDTITLPHVSGVCLESLVSYFYSGSLKINETNIQAMCDAAMALDIPSALDLCKQFLNRSSEICLNREVELKYGCDEDPDDNDGSTDIYQSLDGQPAGKMKTEIKLLDEEEMMKQDFVLEDMTEAVAVSTESELPASKSSMKDDGKTRKPLLPAVNKDELPVKRKRGRPRKNSPQRSQPVTRCVTRSKSSSKLSKEGVRCKKAKLLRLDKVTLKSKNSVSPDCFYKNIKKLVSESGIYICEYCNLTFKFSVGLAHHQSKVHSISVSNTPLQRSRRLLLQRSVNHIILSSASVNGGTNSKRKCSLCSSEHRLISEVKTHFIKNHMYHYVCKIPGCFRKFISRRTLVQHKCCTHSQNKLLLRTNAETVDLSSVLPADEPFSISNKCGWCGMSFALRSELVEHRKMVHRKPKATTSEEVPLVKQRFILRDWNCREKGCNAMFKKKEKLKAHMAELHPSVLFTCPECRFKTQVEQILKRHLLRRHKERHMCQLCGKAYHKPFLLRVHMFNRHKMSDPLLKLYHCQHEGCDYACPSKNGMNLHILKHTSGNPFSCHVCGKSFKRAAGLDKHVNKIHLGIRPYICDKCGVSYGDESELRIHMGRHAENKPYTCDHCTYSTFQKGSLKSHLFCRHQVRMDQEMPVMKCEKCSFTTDKKCRFQDHIKMHNNIRDIPCHECGKMFVTKKTLRQHVIKVHRQKVLGCTHCSFTTALQSKLQEHVRMMHSLSQDVAKFIDMVPQQEEQQQIQQQQQQQQQILQQQLQQQQQQQQLQIQQIHIPQQQLQDQSNCLTSLSLLPVTEYQTLLQMNSNQQMAAAADSAVIVNISMSLDSVSYPCFQTLDRSHLVM